MKYKLYLLLIIFTLFSQSACTESIESTQNLKHFSKDNPIDVLDIVKEYLPKNPTILEAGAWTGTESVLMAKFWPEATLHAFEPLPQAYIWLVQKTKDYSSIYTYKFALSDNVGTAKFYVSKTPGQPLDLWQSSSLLEPKEHLNLAWWVKFDEVINVQTTTIDTWAQHNNIDHIDFMWLDMQGTALQALKAAPKILKTVKAIMIEIETVEAYKNEPQYLEIRQWLENQGFKMIAINFDIAKEWFGDALFVRI